MAIDGHGLSRRAALKAIGAGAGVAAVAACGPAGPSGGGGGGEQGGGPKRGGTLRLGSATDLSNLEIHALVQAARDFTYNAVDSLTKYDDNFKVQPRLAESWEYSADGKQLKLNLRKGVAWHSGRDFTSDDVKYSLLRPRDPKLTNITTSFLVASNWITSIETPDKSTAILRFDKPKIAIFDAFNEWNMVDKEFLEGPKAQTTVSGTGAFKFVEWTPAVGSKWARNPSWWAAGTDKLPHLDEVHVNVFGDTQAMAVALESGSVDAVTIPALRDTVRLKGNPAYRYVDNSKISGQNHTHQMNVTNPPTDNKKVRQALEYALDRKRFVENVMLGLGIPAVLPWKPGTLAYDKKQDDLYKYDIAKATALVKEAGAVGQTVTLHVDNTRPDSVQVAQIWAADIEKTGLKVNLQSVQPQQITDMTRANKNQITVAAGAFSNYEAAYQVAFGALVPGNTSNRFDSPRYRQLIDQAVAEVDTAKRKALYDQISEIVGDEAFYLMHAFRYPTWLMAAKVNGAKFTSGEQVHWGSIWLAG